MSLDLSIGNRRSYAGDICSVRFIGEIPDWPVTALGVEWDNPERGKNNGDLHGVAYFDVAVPRSGSFVKITRKPDPECSLDEALVDRYIATHEIPELKISRSKVMQTLGAEKHGKRTADVSHLPTISLAKCRISRICLSYDLSSLRRLDLSDNLFTGLSDLCEVLAPLNLEYLSLAGNKFDFVTDSGPWRQVPSLIELDLSRTLLSPEETAAVVQVFPNVSSLCLAFNHIQRWPQVSARKLDVSGNLLSTLPADLDLDELNIVENPLVEIPKLSIPFLYMSTLPQGWDDCAKLKCTNLRLGAPFGQQTVFVIGHCGELQVLNGSKITPQERLDAELYTLRQTASGRHELDAERYAELVGVYGMPTVTHFSTSILARQVRIKVESTEIDIVHDASVQRLICVAARRLGKPLLGLALKHGDSVIRTGTIAEHFTGGEAVSLVYV